MNRREVRRKRRIRNQIISYVISAVLLAAVAAGVFFGIRHISNAMQEKRRQEEMQESMEAETESLPETGTSEEGVPETEGQEGTPPAVSEEDLLEEMVNNAIANMSLEDKVAGLFIIRPEAITGVGTVVQAGDGTRDALAKYPVGGLVYFTKNIQSSEQLKEMLGKTAGYAKYPLFLAVDEEGGRVARVAEALGLENVGPMAAVGATGDAQAARNVGTTIGTYLKEFGFNLDFAPVADVQTNPENTVIGDRAFGSDPASVSLMVQAAVEGMQEAGVSACLKHFPGHGNTTGDSHEGAVETGRTLEEMQAAEFLPFQAGIAAGVDMVMVGHISAPGLTGGDALPASLFEGVRSEVLLHALEERGILRNQLGYDGIVVTDAMDMAAISAYYASDEAAIKALKAGADMILMPEDFVQAYEGVIAAVRDGRIDEDRVNDSLKRIYRVKYGDTLAQ